MKNINKLFLLTVLGLQINQMQASDSPDSYSSGNTSLESYETNASPKSARSLSSRTSSSSTYLEEPRISSTGYFVEKLDENGQTQYFDQLLVFKARINKSKKLSYVKKSQEEQTLTITDPITGEQATVPASDFIQCNGPMRELTQDEYDDIVQQNNTKMKMREYEESQASYLN